MMNHPRSKKRFATLAISLLLSTLVLPFMAPVAMAQATTGSIKGTVTDQNGGVVAGATVVAKNQATGVTSPAYKTTGDGLYAIQSLIPGKYTVTVEAGNFKREIFTDVDVRLGLDSVIDATLQPGGASETVTVTAATESTIEKDSSQISSSFEARKVEELPSNVAGAGLDTLALLAPGVTPGFGNVNGNGTTLSVNGNRARSNNFTIDGVDNNDLSIGGPNYFVDNADMVGEFQVITNNFSAAYGRNQGAIVNIVTKGGTNSFHGSGFEFHRDRSNWDSLDNLEKAGGQKAPLPDLYNVFGGTIGGPIKKDRAFFFGSYQGITTREHFLVLGGSLAVLPQGLSQLAADNPNNALIQAYSKYSQFALQNNGQVSPRADLGALAFDTVTINGKSYPAAVYQRAIATTNDTPYTEKEFSGRGDIKVSEKNNVWTRYLFQTENFKNALISNGFVGDEPARSQNLVGTWDRQLSSNSLNEFQFAYSRLFVKFGGGCTNTTPGCIPDPTLIDQAFTNMAFSGAYGDTNGFGLGGVGPATNLPQGRIVVAYQFRDQYSRTYKNHQFQVGADIRRLNNSSPFLPTVNGSFTGITKSRFAVNDPGTVTLAVGTPTLVYNETDQFYYFQDDWKMKDNLTLNLGIRYENTGQPINLLNSVSTARESNPATAVWLQSLPLSVRTVPKIPTDSNNFAPRIGFAYTPRFWKKLLGEDATVIRGGYSIAYDPAFYNILLNVSTSTPMVFNNILPNPAPPTAAIFPVPDNNPFGPAVRAFATSHNIVAVNTYDPRALAQTIVDPNFRSPYAEQWSLGIQRQLNRANVFEVRYLGTHGVGLFQQQITNPQISHLMNGFTTSIFGQNFTFPGFPQLVPAGLTPQTCPNFPGVGLLWSHTTCDGRVLPQNRVLSRQNSAQSIYHSLQTRLSSRLYNQLTVGASYTFSKALDNASEVFAFQETANPQDPFNIGKAERSFSGFDRRHAAAFNWLWDVPLHKDQQGFLGRVLGGWQLNGTYVIASGLRYTPRETFNSSLAVVAGFPTYFDNVTGDVSRPFVGNPNANKQAVGITDVDLMLLISKGILGAPAGFSNTFVHSPTGLFSLNAYNTSKQFVPVSKNDVFYIADMPGAAVMFGSPFGNAARTSLAGPLLNQMNLGIFKNTRINERFTIQLRLEAFNALNHPNPGYGLDSAPGNIDGNGGAIPDNFLNNAGSAFNNPQQVEYNRRIVQIGARIIF
ncbi:MAG TPA: carboxypeptidase regulatory-like domain-containing protein [Blastocatellia bacterium]|nr:carboxypeptidase regulatory-like domain-containing protein [Blastocatellia bacterium]